MATVTVLIPPPEAIEAWVRSYAENWPPVWPTDMTWPKPKAGWTLPGEIGYTFTLVDAASCTLTRNADDALLMTVTP